MTNEQIILIGIYIKLLLGLDNKLSNTIQASIAALTLTARAPTLYVRI